MLNAIDEGYVPVIQTYSTKDDPEKIIKNHKNGFEKMYEHYVKGTRIYSKLHKNVNIEPLTRKEFSSKIEYVAIGQLEGEYVEGEDDIVSRIVY